MSSVTKRISEIKQPRGGYIKPSLLEIKVLDDGFVLFEKENIHPTTIGIVVDYLTRLSMGTDVKQAFFASIQGSRIAECYGVANAIQKAKDFIAGINGIDDKSVINACKMTAFDVWLRNTSAAPMSSTPDEINPDENTIKNIQTMVGRGVSFFDIYGPVMADGFTFEPFGYTKTVSSGDGDYLTVDTLWDFKVSKAAPTNKHTLQLLMYWIMGKHSGNSDFDYITNIGIFNPRLNTVYTLPVSKVDAEIIKTVENEVICY